MIILDLQTHSRVELINVTPQVTQAIQNNDIVNGVCFLFVPHTTAAITVNENADPDVVLDLIRRLEKITPGVDREDQHREGNSAAHVKAGLIGTSEILFIENRKLVLGTWQGIYFCEFDGPRKRKLILKITSES